MNEPSFDLNPSSFRPMWLRGGADAALELQRRYPERPAGLDNIRTALSAESIARAAETNVSHVIIPFDWGFPPEQRSAEPFSEIVERLHEQGLQAVAGIRISSSLRTGTYKDAAWFARTPYCKLIRHSGLDRFMTCLLRPEWQEHVTASIREALAAGADGIMLEETAFGAAPVIDGDRFRGQAGCQCETCRTEFQKSSEAQREGIPHDLGHPVTRLFFEWRARVVTDFVSEMSALVKSLDPSALVAAHAYCLTAGPAFLWFGADASALSQHVDVLFEENNHLPLFSKKGLVYDTPSLTILGALSHRALPGSLPRRWGAGFDPVPPVNLHLIPIAEAVGCRAVHLLNAGEGWNPETNSWEILTEDKFRETREAIGRYNNWLEKNEDFFLKVKPAAAAAVLFPSKEWKWNWAETSRTIFKILQTLVELHIPVRVVTEEQLPDCEEEGVRALIVPVLAEISPAAHVAIHEFVSENALIVVGPGLDNIKSKSLDPDIFKTVQEKRGFLRRLIDRLPPEFPPPPPPTEVIPERWQELFDLVREAVTGPDATIPVIEGAPFIHAHVWSTTASNLYFIVNHVPGLADLNMLALKHTRSVSTRILSPDISKISYLKENTVTMRPTIFTVVETKDPFRRPPSDYA